MEPFDFVQPRIYGYLKIKDYLIKKCKEFNIEPLKFAAGLWFLGLHLLNILLECLGDIETGSIVSSDNCVY
jgi:hypothetical protein